eukprot:1381397-Pleurochrysis_carterae.AAC.3
MRLMRACRTPRVDVKHTVFLTQLAGGLAILTDAQRAVGRQGCLQDDWSPGSQGKPAGYQLAAMMRMPAAAGAIMIRVTPQRYGIVWIGWDTCRVCTRHSVVGKAPSSKGHGRNSFVSS